MSLGQRQDLLLLGPPMVLVECYIRLHFRQEVGKLATAALLVARQRLPEHTDLLGARPVLALQPVEQRSGFRMTQAQEPEQVLVLLGVVEALGVRIDVADLEQGPPSGVTLDDKTMGSKLRTRQ